MATYYYYGVLELMVLAVATSYCKHNTSILGITIIVGAIEATNFSDISISNYWSFWIQQLLVILDTTLPVASYLPMVPR